MQLVRYHNPLLGASTFFIFFLCCCFLLRLRRDDLLRLLCASDMRSALHRTSRLLRQEQVKPYNREIILSNLALSSSSCSLSRLCFAKPLAMLVGEPDDFVAGASCAHPTRRLWRGRISGRILGVLDSTTNGMEQHSAKMPLQNTYHADLTSAPERSWRGRNTSSCHGCANAPARTSPDVSLGLRARLALRIAPETRGAFMTARSCSTVMLCAGLNFSPDA